jgi:predicted MFS family arabinose efflux permease
MLYGVTHHAGGWVFLTSYLLMAASVGSGPVGSTVMKELNRPDAVALSISVLNGLTYVGGGLIANLAGLVLDQFKRDAVVTAGHLVYPCIAYVTLFAILVGLSIMSLAILSRVPETRGQQATKGHGRP